jgi:DNA-directed RNA polymerase specialized sigma24 family protein
MVKKKTTTGPDYETIRKKMVYVFILMGVRGQDAEDLAQEVCLEVKKCYDPAREKHPHKPGEALAYKISYKVRARYFEKFGPPTTTLDDSDEFEFVRAKKEPKPKDEVERQEEVDLVTGWIDDWFKRLTPWEQAIWELRFVYDLDIITIGFIIRGKRGLTHKDMEVLTATHNGAGYRAITPIFMSFVQYLVFRIAEY